MPAPLMTAIIAEYQPPCGLRPDRDTCAVFPGLFPAPSLALARSVYALALATARAFPYASLALGSFDLPPARVPRQGPPRKLAQPSRARVVEFAALVPRAFAQAP